MGITLLLVTAAAAGYAIRKAYKRKKRDTFNISGPYHLNTIDWNNLSHRTSVTSCLVNGVYIMQKDKTENRKPLANPWWESFGFSLVQSLINEADSSIYGAVFKYDKYDSYQNTPHLGIPPRYVIAFRGTLFSSKTWYSDIKQDIRCLFQNLDEGRRFQHAIQTIENVVAKHSNETKSVWLAGHSLGAAIALLAGKTLAIMGSPLETYAFNPPHSALPLEQLVDSDEELRIKVTVASLLKIQIKEDDPKTTAAWTPYLYLNPNDGICSKYIGDFKNKYFMFKYGVRALANISLVNLLFGEGTSSSSSAIQLISSVNMTVNLNESLSFKIAHGIKQWWESNSENWEIQEFRPSYVRFG